MQDITLQGNSDSNMDVAIGAMKTGTEEVLGKVCDVWKKVILTVWPGYGKGLL